MLAVSSISNVPVSASPVAAGVLGFQMLATMFGPLHGFQGPNSDYQEYAAVSLPTEPSLQPQVTFCREISAVSRDGSSLDPMSTAHSDQNKFAYRSITHVDGLGLGSCSFRKVPSLLQPDPGYWTIST